MINKLMVFFCCLFFATNEKTPKTDVQPIPKRKNKKVDTAAIDAPSDGQIYNAKAISDFFQKLEKNEDQKNQKINIVHIGDSHIQSDLMTNEIRKKYILCFNLRDNIYNFAVNCNCHCSFISKQNQSNLLQY